MTVKPPPLNPKAVIPNWTTLCNGGYFFNPRTNQHSAVIISENGSPQEIMAEALEVIFSIPGLSSQLEPTNIERYIANEAVRIKETFVPPQTNQSRKHLCVVNQKGFDRLFEELTLKKDSAPNEDTGVGYLLEISRLDYEKMFTQLTNSLMKVGKDYEFAFRSGIYDVPGLRFGNEINKIKEFDGKFRDFLEQNDVDLMSPTVEKVGLLFDTQTDKKYSRIKSAWAKNITQPWSKLENEFEIFQNSSPVNDPRTLSFILNMPAIARQSSSPLTYDSFINKYVYPAVAPLDISNPSLDSLGALGSFISTPPGNEVAGLLTSFPETFIESIPEEFSVGYTNVQKKELEKILQDPNMTTRRVQDSLLRTVPDIEPLIADLENKLSSIKNLKDLYTGILDPLGVKGIEELLSIAILEKIKNLPLDTAMREVMASMIDALPLDQIYLIYENIIGAVDLDDVTSQIENAFVDIAWPDLFPDIPLPNVDDLELPSMLSGSPIDPSRIPRDKCLGTPMITFDPNLGRIKLAFSHAIREGLIKPENLSDVLDKKRIGGSNNIFNKIFKLGPLKLPSLTPPDFSRQTNDLGPKTRNSQNPDGPETRMRTTKSRKGRAASNRMPKVPVINSKKIYESNRNRTGPKLGDITLPAIPEIPTISLGSLGKIAIQKGEKELEKISLKIGTLLLKKIVGSIFGPMAGGPRIGDGSPDKKDNIRNILKNTFSRSDANDKDVNKAINNILNSFSSWNPSRTPPTDLDVGLFMDAISLSLDPQQILNLFNGTASKETLCQVRQAADSLPNKTLSLAIPSENDISDMFAGLGTLVDRNTLQNGLNLDNSLNNPATPIDLCLSPAQLLALNNENRLKLAEKGLTSSEIDNQMKNAEARILDDLSDLVKAGVNPGGIFTDSGELPVKQTPDGLVISPMSSDPRDPNAGLFPMTDASTQSAVGDTYKSLYDSMNSITVNDLAYGNPKNITSRGFLDMVLSTTKGRPFSKVSDDLLIGDGSGLFSNPELPDTVSTLKEQYDDPSAAFSVNAAGTEIESEFEDSEFTYILGGNVFITKSPTREIQVDYERVQTPQTSEANQVVENISSANATPRAIFSQLVKTSLDESLKPILANLGATESGAHIIRKIKNYAEVNLYGQIIQRQISLLSSPIANNSRAWNYFEGDDITAAIGTPVTQSLPEEDYGLGAFYIEFDRDQSGPTNWLEIYLAANPIELFGDTPPIFNFDDLAVKSQQYFDSMPDDPRLELPDVQKIKESPFCRINSRLNNAGLAGLVKSLVRAYVYDALLKGTPTFQVYEMNTNNLGPVFISYVTQNILDDVMAESTKVKKIIPNTLGAKGFYYIFLEQLVQSYANLTNLGIEATNSITLGALDKIKDNLGSWNPGKMTYLKDFKQFLEDQIPSIKKILNTMVEEELNTVGQKTLSLYRPAVGNIKGELISNPDWMIGATSSPTGLIEAPSVFPNTELTDNGWSGARDTYTPFILETYVRQQNLNTGESQILSPSSPDIISAKGLEYYAGVRIVLAMPDDFVSDLVSFTPAMEQFLNDAREIAFNSTKSFASESPLAVPLIEVEELFAADTLPDSSVYRKLADNLKSTPEYEVLFERCFSVVNLLSYMTIYNVENFVDSLASREALLPTAFNIWNGQTFETTKKFLKSSMQQFYYGRSAEFVEEALEEMNAATAMSSTLAGPIMKKALSQLDIPRKERKNLRDKPDNL